MKNTLKKTLNDTERQILQLLLYGYTEAEVAEGLKFKIKTVQENRRRLCSTFGADTNQLLCQKAIIYGYAPQFLEELESIREKADYKSLSVWECGILHQLFDGLLLEDVKRTIGLEADRFDFSLNNLIEKLKIKDIRNVTYPAVVAGYRNPVKIDIEELDEAKVKEAFGAWMTVSKIAKIPQYKFEKKFRLLTRKAAD